MTQRQYKRSQDGRFSVTNSLSSAGKSAKDSAQRWSDLEPSRNDLIALGAGVLGAKTGFAGRNAVKLRRLSPEKAKQAADFLNKNPQKRIGMEDLVAGDPKTTFRYTSGKDARDARKNLKNANKGKVDLKHIQRSAGYWEKRMSGPKQSRNSSAGKFGSTDLYHFDRRNAHRYLSRVVDQASPVNYELRRGVGVTKPPKIGDELSLDQSSWTTDSTVPNFFATRSAGKRPKRGQPKQTGAVFVLPKGQRALDISGISGMAQKEHLTPPGKYRVTDVRGGEVWLERIGKAHTISAFGIDHGV